MSGFLDRLDARIAFAGLLIISTAPFIVTDLAAILLLMMLLLVLALFHRDALSRYHRGARGLLAMVLFVGSLQILLAGGAPLLELKVLGRGVGILSAEGLYLGGVVIARLSILSVSSLLFSSTVDDREFLTGLRSLGLPSNIALSIDLVIRMLPRMMEDISEVRDAYAMREGGVSQGGYLRRWGTYLKIVRPFFGAYIAAAHRLGLSMEMRGYKGELGYERASGRIGAIDVAAISILTLLSAVFLFLALARPDLASLLLEAFGSE